MTTLAVCLLVSLLNVTDNRYRPAFLSSQAQVVLSFGMFALIPVFLGSVPVNLLLTKVELPGF